MTSNRTPLSQCISPAFYELHKGLKEEKFSEVWLRGGRGSTKSSFLSIEVVLAIINDPEANAVIFRRFENEIRDTVFGQVQWAVNKLGVDHLFKVYVSPFKLVYEPTGQMILFKGADNPKKLKSIKLAKGYLKIGWFEEVDQFSGMDEIRNIQQSLFRGTQKKQMAWFSYNPPKSARSWVNEESKIPKEGRVVHYSDYRSVPEDWLGDTFLANAEHLKETNEEAYRHEYLGEETGTGLEVFNNVTLRKITNKEIAQFDRREQGLDFGYAADPVCFLEGHFDAKKRKLYLFYEYSGVKITDAQLAGALTEERRAEMTMADPHEPKSIDVLRDEHKMNVVPADAPPGSVDFGTKYLQDLEEIVIDPERCPLAATEFINYALDMNRFGEVVSKYPDKNNHCFVGETLVSTTKGPTRIDCIQPGDMVLTRKGPRKVNKVFRNHLPTVTTRLLNGGSLTLTDTHDIITKHGKVMFKDLTSRDIVYYEDESCGFIEMENRKLPYFRARSIAAIQTANDEVTECISSVRLRQAQTNTSMLLSMRATMGLCQKVAIYTIKTGTLSTMIRAISCVLAVQNISVSLLGSIMRVTRTLSERISTVFAPLRRIGMRVMRVVRGTLNMPERYFRIEIPLSEPVSSAVLPSIQSTLEKLDSARTTASRRGGGLLASTTSSGSVRSAGRGSRSIGTRRSGRVRGRVEHVYDLEIDEVHEYFANGILVSNSIDATRYMMSRHIMQDRMERRKSKFKARPMPVTSRWGR